MSSEAFARALHKTLPLPNGTWRKPLSKEQARQHAATLTRRPTQGHVTSMQRARLDLLGATHRGTSLVTSVKASEKCLADRVANCFYRSLRPLQYFSTLTGQRGAPFQCARHSEASFLRSSSTDKRTLLHDSFAGFALTGMWQQF